MILKVVNRLRKQADKDYKVFISTHAVFIDQEFDVHGPGHSISSVLKFAKIPHFYLRHPLTQVGKSLLETFDGKNSQKEYFGLTRKWPAYINFFQELAITTKIFYNLPKFKVFIGIDPLNALIGIFLKKLGKVEKIIFYTADYADQRFPNPLLNFIYHVIDKFSIKRADFVWNVSTRIQKKRTKLGLTYFKNLFVPNSPLISEIPKSKKFNRQTLVLVANFPSAIDYKLILATIRKLSLKLPKLRLYLIGEGGVEKEVRNQVKKMSLEQNVVFLGKKRHQQLLKLLTTCAIGLAPYTDEVSWIEYGDSMKAREYLACGLPVIITDNVSTADDIEKYQAGFKIQLSQDKLYWVLSKLLLDDKVFVRMKKNALKLAKEFDFEKIIEKQLIRKFL